MGADRAIRQIVPGQAILKDSIYEEVSSILLGCGRWALFGRVCIANADEDAQDIIAQLRVNGSTPIDTLILKILPRDQGCFSLQTLVLLEPGSEGKVSLVCHARDGLATSASLIAISADTVIGAEIV